MKTAYTISENVGDVEVCVNLTQPELDILSEEVYVMVFNNDSSIYIPDHGVLASKSSYLIIIMITYPNCHLLQLLTLLIS